MAKYEYVTREMTVDEAIAFQYATKTNDVEAAVDFCVNRRVDQNNADDHEYLHLSLSLFHEEFNAAITAVKQGQDVDNLLQGVDFGDASSSV